MNSDLYKPSYLKELCHECHLVPSKKYGQNYLISQKPIEKMIEAGEVSSDDTIVEIGPGFGVLTFDILKSAKRVIAFEIEKKLLLYWEEKQKEHENLEIVWGNALKQLEDRVLKLGEYKILANLPYQITSFALRTFLELENKPERIIVMVQKEVADRMCAKAGDMSVLSVSVQYYGTPRIVTKVKKGSFWPAPKVDSAVVAIENIVSNAEVDKRFFEIVRAGFSSKRKQLAKNISNVLGIQEKIIRDALSSIVNNDRVRAEELSVEDWKVLVEKI
jgi:16S rRNA (adenine1518-N6/adenine1519-N6)-dimethyltransferase